MERKLIYNELQGKEETSADGAVKGLQGWIDCCEKAELAGDSKSGI